MTAVESPVTEINNLNVIVSEDGMAKIEVTLDILELYPYQKQFIQEKRKHVILRGYRKGTAPESMVAKYFAEEARETAKNNVLYSKYMRLLQEHKLQPLTQPKLNTLTENNNTIAASFSVEVLAPVVLGQYMGLELNKMPLRSSVDEAVANTLTEVRQIYPKLNGLTDAVIDDKKVAIVDFIISVDGEEFEKHDELRVVMGTKLFFEEFETNLIGLKAGDKKEFSIMFPETYINETLRNKKGDFVVVVKSVNEQTQYSDEELPGIIGYENKEKMYESIKKDIEQRYKEEEYMFYEDQLLAQLLEAHTFKISKILTDEESKKVALNRPDMPKEEIEVVADRFVRTDLVLAAIYERHPDIHLTEELFRDKLTILAARAGDTLDNVVMKLQADGKFNAYMNYLKNCRVIEFLIEMADVKDSNDKVMDKVNIDKVEENTNG